MAGRQKPPPIGVISTRFALVSLDLQAKVETIIPVLSHYDGAEVTMDMVKAQAQALNSNCSCHGVPHKGQTKLKRTVAFYAVSLPRKRKGPPA